MAKHITPKDLSDNPELMGFFVTIQKHGRKSKFTSQLK